MNVKVNGFRAGVMATLLAIGGAGCKRAPFVEKSKELIPQRMETVVDSFYKEGQKIANNLEFVKHGKSDTVQISDSRLMNPEKLARFLDVCSSTSTYVTTIDGFDFHYPSEKDVKFVITNNQIYTSNGKDNYIVIQRYDKNN